MQNDVQTLECTVSEPASAPKADDETALGFQGISGCETDAVRCAPPSAAPPPTEARPVGLF